MKIYVSHASKFDYINKLYNPIKESKLFKKHEFILPHDGDNVINTKEIISKWADFSNVPIICIYEKGAEISSALKFITKDLIEYENIEDMINKIKMKLISYL